MLRHLEPVGVALAKERPHWHRVAHASAPHADHLEGVCNLRFRGTPPNLGTPPTLPLPWRFASRANGFRGCARGRSCLGHAADPAAAEAGLGPSLGHAADAAAGCESGRCSSSLLGGSVVEQHCDSAHYVLGANCVKPTYTL